MQREGVSVKSRTIQMASKLHKNLVKNRTMQLASNSTE